MSLISNNKVENNKYEMEFEISAEAFEAALQAAYERAKKNISVPGFRKGKAPRKMIEKMYGENAFYEDAVNYAVPQEIQAALDENKLTLVDEPNVDVTAVDKENGVKFKATIITKPEVSISDYLGIEVDKVVNLVTDDDINAQIDRMRERNARLVSIDDRAAEKGDISDIDFEGFVDGEAFEGGKAEGFELELGSGQFIEGFEDQVIGHNAGDEFDVNVTFPEEYHAENLKGKAATFKVKLNALKKKELPELDDDFVKDATEFDSVDALKADLKEKMEAANEKKAEQETETNIFNKLIEKMEADIPSVMFEKRVAEMVQDFRHRIEAQGMDLNLYLKYTGMDLESFKKSFEDRAQQEVKLRLALEKVAELEKIEVTSDEIEAELKAIADLYRMDIKKVKARISPKDIFTDLAVSKAANLVKDSAKIS
ncbi:MAG: trigger factor [Ruminococcus sp.]|nr:trigger factor [Ruminococcus sp.]